MTLAEPNSAEALQKRFGEQYSSAIHRPISRLTSGAKDVIDLTGGAQHRRRLSVQVGTLAQSVATLSEQMKQVLQWICHGIGSGPPNPAPATTGSPGSRSDADGAGPGGTSSGGPTRESPDVDDTAAQQREGDTRGGGSTDYEAELEAALKGMKEALEGDDNMCADSVFELGEESSLTGKELEHLQTAITNALESWKPNLNKIIRTDNTRGGARTKAASALFHRLLSYITQSTLDSPSLPPNVQAARLVQYTPLFTALYPPGKFVLSESMLVNQGKPHSFFDTASARNVLDLYRSLQH